MEDRENPEKENLENLKKRIEVFRNMLAADPENELASFSLGKLLFEYGDLGDSETSLRKALELNPMQSVAYQFLGEGLLRQGRKDEAAETLGEGMQIAHRKGDYQPRNRMRELLLGLGVEPPTLETSTESSGSAAASGASGDWICRRCGLDNPRVEKPPFKSALGERIQSDICATCWDEWKREVSIKVINEYRLNLATEEGSRAYDQYMKEYLGLGDD